MQRCPQHIKWCYYGKEGGHCEAEVINHDGSKLPVTFNCISFLFFFELIRYHCYFLQDKNKFFLERLEGLVQFICYCWTAYDIARNLQIIDYIMLIKNLPQEASISNSIKMAVILIINLRYLGCTEGGTLTFLSISFIFCVISICFVWSHNVISLCDAWKPRYPLQEQ